MLPKSPLKIKISDVKIITFFKHNSMIVYKYSFSDTKECSSTFELKDYDSEPKKCYNAELPINQKKYNDLKNLCQSFAIQPNYHFEYLTLRTNTAVPDVLPESDIEDLWIS